MHTLIEPQVDRSPAPFSHTFRSLCIIGVVAVILALPMLVYGPMLRGHDTYEHINYSRHFSEQFWAGEWYPRWLIGMNHGLGSPSLFVYPPFPGYVFTLLEPPGRVLHFDPFKMGEFLALLGSGICAFLWLTTMAGESVAVVGASLYMLVPYHLAVDFYRRTALSECWALVWMPLVLYFSAKPVRQGRIYLVGFAVAYAALILSHLVSVFIFSLVPLGAAIVLSPPGRKVQTFLRVVAGMLLGIGLSCFYFISALAHAKYFPVSRLPLWTALGNHLVTAGTLLHRTSDDFIRLISFTVFDTAALCLICGILVLTRGRLESKKKASFWLAVCVIPVLLMHGRSARVWKMFPPLFAAIQYPWRLNIVLSVASIAIVTVFLSEVSASQRKSRPLALCLLSIFLATWLISYGSIWSRYRVETPRQMSLVDDDDGWFPAWSAPGTDEASALRASLGPQVRFLTGSGSAIALLWKPRHIEVQTNSPTGGIVMINQFYYPAWRAVLLSPYHMLDIKAAMPEGLMELQVPPGLQQVQLEIPIGRAEHIGRWISAACALLSMSLIWTRRRDKGDSIPIFSAEDRSRNAV